MHKSLGFLAKIITILALGYGIHPSATHACVVINELMPQTGVGGRYDHEWIELKNDGPDFLNLGGWSISVDPSRYTFPDFYPDYLDQGMYLVLHGRNQDGTYAQGFDGLDAQGVWHFYMGGIPGTLTPPHGRCTLSNTGASVALYDTQNTLVDWISYKGEAEPSAPSCGTITTTIDPDTDASLARCVDLNGIYLLHTPAEFTSPGEHNLCSLPSPTPTPSKSPTQTHTPSPTRTPTTTRTASPTRTPTNTATPACGCASFTTTLSPGWNLIAFAARPIFGTSLARVFQEMLAQGNHIELLALWEKRGWYVCGPASPPRPEKTVDAHTGMFVYCTTEGNLTYVGCTP